MRDLQLWSKVYIHFTMDTNVIVNWLVMISLNCFFHGTSVMTSKKKNWVYNFYFGFSLVHTGTKAYRQVKYIHEFT